MDIYAERKLFIKSSLAVYVLGIDKKIHLFTTSNTITTLHYLLKKILSEEKIRLTLEHIIEHVSIIPIDINIIKKSLKSNHKDFEDAVQIISAQSIKDMDCIVTRDLKDYKNAEINVFTPDDFLNSLK